MSLNNAKVLSCEGLDANMVPELSKPVWMLLLAQLSLLSNTHKTKTLCTLTIFAQSSKTTDTKSVVGSKQCAITTYSISKSYSQSI